MRFFVLKNPKVDDGSAVTDFSRIDGSPMGEAPRCPVCSKFRGMLPLIPPVIIDLEAWGRVWGDVAFGTGDQLLISARLSRLFHDNYFVGISSLLPIKIAKITRRGRTGDPPPDYFLATIVIGTAAIDDFASGMEREEPWTCNECRIGGIIKTFKAVIFEPETWSGQDIFFARGLPGIVLVTERFKVMCESNEIANAHFVPTEEFGMPLI